MPDEVLVCMPISWRGYVVPGSLPDKCAECGQPVWVAPSGFLIIHDNPGIQLQCLSCVSNRIVNKGPVLVHDATPAQLDEIEEYRRAQNS